MFLGALRTILSHVALDSVQYPPLFRRSRLLAGGIFPRWKFSYRNWSVNDSESEKYGSLLSVYRNWPVNDFTALR